LDLRFGLDARLAFFDGGGIGRYIRCLAAALEQESAPDAFTVVTDFRDSGWGGNSRGVIGSARSTRLDWLFALQVAALRFDLLHYPDHVIPRRSPGRSVVTVHDVSFWRIPESHSPASRTYYERCLDSVRRADAVICVSEFTREELLATTKVDPEQTFTINQGLEPRFAPAGDERQEEVRLRYELRRPYLLCLGTIGRRKNLVRLVEAFADSPVLEGTDLVLAGAVGNALQEVREAVERQRAGDRVRLIGVIADEDVPAVISAAAALVMPSLYEGFGLPVLEAMGCGTPVLIADRRPLTDVAGGAAIVVAPDDRDSIREGLERRVSDSVRRDHDRQLGLERARLFDWNDVARQTLGVYRRVSG
ncbi:MAG TPA: glycosyltransferase family 1 protein, partial [Chloroflexota bacterium]|nr:glycosyltransferase family 1 protein [Chloroflexota bacterium]